VRGWAVRAALFGVALAGAAAFGGQQYADAREKKRLVAEALTGGNAMRGSALYRSFGCGACHAMESRGLPQGQVGPELSGLRERAYIAGRLPNRPENLIRWIADPFAVDPQTAMPDLGVAPDQARDLAAYLYWDS
jgi:cytochrome c